MRINRKYKSNVNEFPTFREYLVISTKAAHTLTQQTPLIQHIKH